MLISPPLSLTLWPPHLTQGSPHLSGSCSELQHSSQCWSVVKSRAGNEAWGSMETGWLTKQGHAGWAPHDALCPMGTQGRPTAMTRHAELFRHTMGLVEILPQHRDSCSDGSYCISERAEKRAPACSTHISNGLGVLRPCCLAILPWICLSTLKQAA